MTFPFALLIARQRSGTGALGTVLNKHPQLRYLGEVFHPENIGKFVCYFSFLLEAVERDKKASLPDRGIQNLDEFLESTNGSPGLPILDVKYSSLHHLNGSWQSPFGQPAILQHAQVRGAPVIHLTRKNLVEVFVSGLLADANKIWHTADADDASIKSVAVDPQNLLRFIAHAQEEQKLVARWLVNHPRVISLDYSEMLDAEGLLAQEFADRIASAFEVESLADRAPSFAKQAPSRLSQSIENFDEVKRLLSSTEHAWMVGEAAVAIKKNALDGLSERNRAAIDQVPVFRGKRRPEQYGKIDDLFHWYKNHYPYYGPVNVEIGDQSLVMFAGNDDLVALTYFWSGASSFEPRSMDLWKELCADAEVVFDVGAHSALYSLLAASVNPTCRVTAFEPSRRTHGRILLNSYMNGLQRRIKAMCLAVSDEAGQTRLLQYRGENILGVGAAIVEKDMPVTDDSEIVDIVALDDFCQEHDLWPDLMKIDVEGSEVLALKGARKLLHDKRPQMLIEVTPKTAPNVHSILSAAGYSMYAVNEDEEALGFFEGRTSSVHNILARPEPAE